MKLDINPMYRLAAASLAGLLCTTPVLAESFRCDISVKQQCQLATGCTVAPAKVFNRVDLSLSTYSRCDTTGCDEYQASLSKSGIFVQIDVPGRGMLAKLDLDTLEFLEVVTLTIDVVYVSWGACRETSGE